MLLKPGKIVIDWSMLVSKADCVSAVCAFSTIAASKLSAVFVALAVRPTLVRSALVIVIVVDV